MKIDRTGLILYVTKYSECIDFYQNVLELSILFQNDELTCFDLFGTYLMVEIDDRDLNIDIAEKIQKPPTCIRLNVENPEILADHLASKNISADYQKHDWGQVVKFFDPDGNLLAFKDSASFEKQIESLNN